MRSLFSFFISPERHYERRSGYRIVNYHATQTINTLNQFSSDNLFRCSLSDNFPFPQCNQMAGVTTGLIKIVQYRRQGIAFLAFSSLNNSSKSI